ncbi:2,3-diaminopropionate biosynthesis protein SbnB [Photorhabdus africana]|uniref:2,3-diaminopropionate biosynthesis protein SbnB n=1 Tax=Photorhabdus africana TaxID=3097554 RepID=UPI002B401AE3|nr:2,3-diaminopropionate biosynthesis protein SbnB [Photorhabdus sp. CRI-LC]
MKYNKQLTLKIIGADHIEQWLRAHPLRVFERVRQVYLDHAQGRTVNPDSNFLCFPDSDINRIIALPAALEDDNPIAGIKWIASFPHNVKLGIDRASALLILNDRYSGYPLVCMEGCTISAARTAASAAVGAHYLHPTSKYIRGLGIIGCGPISYRTVSFLLQLGWRIDSISLNDLLPERANLFLQKCAHYDIPCNITSQAEVIQSCDMVVFATSAVRPSVEQHHWFSHSPTVLHISLRDLAPNVVQVAQNITDDVTHCLRANTSLELAWRAVGHHRFIDGDIADVIVGHIVPDPERPRIFSPFGMGVLDLALARDIVTDLDVNNVLEICDFFPAPYQKQSKSY